MINVFKRLLTAGNAAGPERSVVEAYDTWSASYDAQPGNLMLDLDAILLDNLLKDIDLTGKKVLEIGCGTGRHWEKIYERSPAIVMGFDVSPGMLRQLSAKYPQAITQKI